MSNEHHDTDGERGIAGADDESEALERATNVALQSEPPTDTPEPPQPAPSAIPAGETVPPKRGRGRPRKYPLPGTLAPGPQPAPLPATPPAPSANELAAMETLVDGLIQGVEDLVCGFSETIVIKRTHDASLAKSVKEVVRIGEKARAMIRLGGIGCAQKYLPQWQATPEAMLGGGVALWLIGVTTQLRMVLPQKPANP